MYTRIIIMIPGRQATSACEKFMEHQVHNGGHLC